MVLVTAPRSFLSKRSFVWKMSALSTPYCTIAAWKQFTSFGHSYIILNILRSSCCHDLQMQKRQTCSTTMFSISLKPAPEVFIFFIAPGHRVFINLCSIWCGTNKFWFPGDLQRMTPFCRASAYAWFSGHSPRTVWANIGPNSWNCASLLRRLWDHMLRPFDPRWRSRNKTWSTFSEFFLIKLTVIHSWTRASCCGSLLINA